jgi:bifunctional non-homologous end joining protein LigD
MNPQFQSQQCVEETAMPALDVYQKKRNFDASPEPHGKKKARKSDKSLSFVIQKHAASHLHYDFRLELGGTLKSWAVPKGPSLDPGQKRLAMHVEDHPLEYADFEGTIPAGNYGAGTVIVWDNGDWIPKGDPGQGYDRGKLEFELRGKKLTGAWVLVKTHGRQKNAWLLIKHRDAAARPSAQFNVVEASPDSVLSGASGRVWHSNKSTETAAAKTRKKQPAAPGSRKPVNAGRTLPKGAAAAPLPLTLAPQLATLVDDAPKSGNWLWELKFDGYRILSRIQDGEVKLFTRNGNDWTSRMPHLARALSTLPVGSAWLDGEIVVTNDKGIPDFQALQNAFENAQTSNIAYYLFDIPYLNDHDLRQVRLDERRNLLAGLLKRARAPLLFSQSFEFSGSDLLKNACAMQLEGLVGKRAASPYQSVRSRDWIKLKCLQRQEFVIGGFTDSNRPSREAFGSLLLGVHEMDGSLRYAGRVGTGFTATSLRELMARMKPLIQKTKPFDIFTSDKTTRDVHWLNPKLVCEVAFGEWTRSGHIRHASFQGLRADKQAAGITAELPVKLPTAGRGRRSARKKTNDDPADIIVTHGDRIIDPSTGFTKGQLVEVYRQLAPSLLEHLADRPVSLVRAPTGIEGQRFFQKHLDTVKVPHIRLLDRDYFPRHPPLITVDSEIAVVACAQMNVIEFHTWNSRNDDNVHPDRMTFDLDPGDGVSWSQMLDATRMMKVMLDELELKSYLKTSGGKGLHLVVPIKRMYDWNTVKNFSCDVVRHMAKTLPMFFVAKSGPRNRIGRIFIDYLRNGRGATTVSAFSVRARPGLGVSIPVSWAELDKLTGGNHWHVFNFSERLNKKYEKVWSGYKSEAQSLKKAMTRLKRK